MSFLNDVFQTADEIKQNQEKFKSAVEASFRRRHHSRQRPMRNSKTKTALPAPTGKAAEETGKYICSKRSRPYNSTERSV